MLTASETTPERAAGADPWLGRAAAAVTVLLLGLATWGFHGYSYGVWPQPGFLVNVLRFDGELTNDWFTSLPAVHWAFANGFGLLPFSWLEPAVLVVWLAYLAILWGAFTALGRTLGLDWVSLLGAGTLIAATDLNGLGLSGVVQGYLYPTGLAFALALASMALLVRDRVVLAGAALGLAALVHPGTGALMILVIAPAVLIARPDRWSALARFLVPCIVLAAPSLYHVAADQASGATMSARERFELLAEVRLPHHLLYAEFPLSEYLATTAWGVLAAIAAWVLRAGRPVRILSGVGVLTLALCALGALASIAERPVTLVQIQTSRITPLLVLFGVLGAAALLVRLAGRWAGPALLVCAGVSIVLFDDVTERVVERVAGAGHVRDVTLPLVQAALIAVALVAAWLAGRRRPQWQNVPVAPAVAVGATVAALAVAALGLAEFRSERDFGESPEYRAMVDVADRAREATRTGELVLAPPDLDLMHLTRRPGVVTFGTYAFGSDDDEWVRRMVAVTGEPGIVDASLGQDAYARNVLIAESYDRRMATSPEPVCEFDPAVVITRAAAPPSPWLQALYRNDLYVLSRPVAACD